MDLLFTLLPFIVLLVSTSLVVAFSCFPYFRKHLIKDVNQKAWENDWHVYFFTKLGEGHTFAYESKFVARLAFVKHVISPEVEYTVQPPDDYSTTKKVVQIRENQKKLITMVNPKTQKRLYTYVG